jgi:hypothetical protein
MAKRREASREVFTVRCTLMTLTEEDARPSLADLPPRGARCRDCDTDTLPLKANGKPKWKAWDNYVASDAAWIEAGMARKRWSDRKRWSTGFLCLPCLGRRLGRVPVPGSDLIAWPVSASNKGLTIAAVPEYVDRIHKGRGY